MKRSRLENRRGRGAGSEARGAASPGAADAPRPRGRPRSASAHDAILAAAVALVRDVGYDAVTIEAIAARARVGKTTVYRRWEGKETLVSEAIEHLMSDAMRVPDTGTTRGDVRALMRVAEAMYADAATPLLLSGLVAAMARSDAIARAVRSSFVARWRDAMRAVLQRGVGRGDLGPGTDLELALDLLSGPALHRALIGGRRVDAAFMHGVADAVLRAFAPAAAADAPNTSSRRRSAGKRGRA